MPLRPFNMQNKKRKVLTITCFLIWFCFNKEPNNHMNRAYLKAFLLNYGENRAHTKNTYLEMSIVCHYMALMI